MKVSTRPHLAICAIEVSQRVICLPVALNAESRRFVGKTRRRFGVNLAVILRSVIKMLLKVTSHRATRRLDDLRWFPERGGLPPLVPWTLLCVSIQTHNLQTQYTTRSATRAWNELDRPALHYDQE